MWSNPEESTYLVAFLIENFTFCAEEVVQDRKAYIFSL